MQYIKMQYTLVRHSTCAHVYSLGESFYSYEIIPILLIQTGNKNLRTLAFELFVLKCFCTPLPCVLTLVDDCFSIFVTIIIC